MTSGNAVSTPHSRASGKSVRAVSQASGTATTMDAAVTVATSSSVRSRISSVRARRKASQNSAPAPSDRTVR